MWDDNRSVTGLAPAASVRPSGILSSSRVLLLVLFLCSVWLTAACTKPEDRWQVGGLYSISTGEHEFGIAKVLAIDPGVVSVRIYKQTFPDRPKQIDPSALTLGGLNEKGMGFGIGHLPLSMRTFELSFPVFIMKQDVTDDELVGYRTWKQSGAGPYMPGGASEPPSGADAPSEGPSTPDEPAPSGGASPSGGVSND
jgi:hypothetical protein